MKEKARTAHPLALLGLSLAWLAVGCQQHHSYGSTETLRRAAHEQSLGRGEVEGIKIFLDTSGSMRGFALGATTYQAKESDQYRSILIALDSLSSAIQIKPKVEDGGSGVHDDHQKEPISPHQTSSADTAPVPLPAPIAVSRFGGSVEALPGGVSLLDASVGRNQVGPIGGRTLPSKWNSRDCSTSHWGGSSLVRSNLDSFYSEGITCLNLAFDEILADRSGKKVYVIVTDAEQDAPEDSSECPSAKNPGNIQTRLYEWVHDRGNFAAVVAFKIRSFPWRAEAVGDRFCGCATRNLFVYLFTPSAEVAEQLFSHLSTFWKGDPESIAYLPFSPRPASEFQVQMSLPKTKGSSPAIVPSEASKDSTDPAVAGTLPQFWIKLNEDQATVSFKVLEAGFESPETRKGPGFCPIDWSKAQYAWSDQPTRLTLRKTTDKVSAKPPTPEALVSTDDPGGLTFVRPAEEYDSANSKSITRVGHYNARSRQLSQEHMTHDLSESTYVVRKRPGQAAHGCEIYLFELKTTSLDLLNQISQKLPLVRDAQPPCTSIENVRNQVQFVYRPSPVVRFLLHVDY